MTTTRWNETTIIAVLREAGAGALQAQTRLTGELKHDHSLVTSADREIEQLLRDRLVSSLPETCFIGEETAGELTPVEMEQALEGTTWVVDPIDGTAAYAQGLPTWGVAVGLMDAGHMVEGAIYVPVEDQLLMTSGGSLLHTSGLRSGRSVAPRLKELQTPEIPEAAYGMVSISQEIAKRGRFHGPAPVHAVASSVYSVMHLLLGRYSAYVAALKLWDIAAVLPMLKYLDYAVLFNDKSSLGCEVSSSNYVLDPRAPKAFSLRAHIFIAPTEKAALDLIRDIRLPGR